MAAHIPEGWGILNQILSYCKMHPVPINSIHLLYPSTTEWQSSLQTNSSGTQHL
jgi:hypothetical protein